MTSFWDTLDDQVAPAEARVKLCLRGDLVALVDRLEADLREAEARDAHTNAPDEAPAVRRELAKAKADVVANTTTFVFHAIGERGWSDLMAKHPPERKNPDHEGFGFHPETFPPAAIAASLHQIISGDGTVTEGATEAQVRTLQSRLGKGQWERLWATVITANMRVDDPGKFVNGSELRLSSEPNSTTAAPEASPAASS